MESQCSRIPLPDGTAPSHEKTQEQGSDAPRDWSRPFHQEGPSSPRPAAVPRPQGRIPRIPRGSTQPQHCITRNQQRLRTPPGFEKKLLPRRPTPAQFAGPVKFSGIPSAIPNPVPRLNLTNVHAHNDDEENSDTENGGMRRPPPTSFDEDSTCAYSIDELSQVSSAVSDIPLTESKAPRNAMMSTYMANVEEEGQEIEQSEEEDEVGSPYLQGMGCNEGDLYSSMHVFQGSVAGGSPYLQGMGCGEDNLHSSINDFRGSEGISMQGESDIEEQSSDAQETGDPSSEPQSDWSDRQPRASRYEFDDCSGEEGSPEFHMDIAQSIDWRMKRLQYAQQTSGEEEEDELEEGGVERENWSEEDDAHQEGELSDSEQDYVQENISRLSNIKYTPRCLYGDFDKNGGGSVGLSSAEMHRSPAVHVSIDVSNGLKPTVSELESSPAHLPVEAPFKGKMVNESNESLGCVPGDEASPYPIEQFTQSTWANQSEQPNYETIPEAMDIEEEGNVAASQSDVVRVGHLSAAGNCFTPETGLISKHEDLKEVEEIEPPSEKVDVSIKYVDPPTKELPAQEADIFKTREVLDKISDREEADGAPVEAVCLKKIDRSRGQVLQEIDNESAEGAMSSGEVGCFRIHSPSDLKEAAEEYLDEEKKKADVGSSSEFQKSPGNESMDVDAVVVRENRIWSSVGWFAMCAICMSLLVTMMVLCLRVLSSALSEPEVKMPSPFPLYDLPPLPEYSLSPPAFLETDTDLDNVHCTSLQDAMTGIQRCNSEFHEPELNNEEMEEEVRNSYSQTIENGLRNLWDFGTGVLFLAIVPTSLLGWVKLLEWIFGGLIVFWLLLF